MGPLPSQEKTAAEESVQIRCTLHGTSREALGTCRGPGLCVVSRSLYLGKFFIYIGLAKKFIWVFEKSQWLTFWPLDVITDLAFFHPALFFENIEPRVYRHRTWCFAVTYFSLCVHAKSLCNPATCQVPLSMGFSREEYWSRLPCPPAGDLPNPGIEPVSPVAPALHMDSLRLSHQGSPIWVK